LSIKGRQLLDPGSPLVVHTPGRDVEKLNFISSRFNERGYAAVSFTSKYSKEDSINYMICSDKVNLNTKHKITIMTYLDAVNTKVFNFAQSIRSTNYPLNKIQIIIIMNKDCPAIKQYFSDLDVASIDYIEVKKETNMSWHEGLIFYLKNHQNYGLLLWRQNLITDENFIDNMCNQNCAASQPLICHKDNPKIVKASKFIKHQNTAVHLDMNELNKNFFIDWIENAPIFAIRSQWLMLAKNDGFKYMNLDTNVGLEGWLFKTLRTKSYLVKNTSAWILNDNNVGFKAIIKNDEVKIYQKQFLYNV
jgi:hypothetical protein